MTKLYRCLQIATAAVFFGRAYQHFFWDAPFRTLFWDETLFAPIVSLFTSLTWEQYINSLTVDDTINQVVFAFGGLYLICGLLTLFLPRLPKALQRMILLGGAALIFLALLLWKEKFYSIGQFFEYSLQFTLPFFLYQLTRSEKPTPRFIFLLKLAIAITFICHGLYAIGYYPQPGTFMNMTVEITGWSDATASGFLKLMGFLDFVVAGLLFVPRVARPALLYMVAWGFFTALARIWANFDIGDVMGHLHQTGYSFLYRVGHFLVPFGVWVYLGKEEQ